MARSARRKRHPSTTELIQAVADLQRAILPLEDMEVVVLKSHLMSEILLRFILAVRLDIQIESLPALSYQPLVILAMGGPGRRRLKKDLLRLNELRNDLAHEFLETTYSAGMWSFVNRWRKATGKRRVRWVYFAKLRFYKLNYQLLLDFLKIGLLTKSDQEKAEIAAQLPPEWRFIISEPDTAWPKLVTPPPKWKAPLMQSDLVSDAAAASRAAVEGTKLYGAILDEFADLYTAGIIDRAEIDRVEADSVVIREHGRRVIALVKEWRAQNLHEQFPTVYEPYVVALEKLRSRLAQVIPHAAA